MKHLVMALAALALLGTILPAKAACPVGTTYSCSQGYNGKVICGCH